MGKKDIETNRYTRKHDVIADIINCSLGNGQQLVHPADIHDLDTRELVLIPPPLHNLAGESKPVQKYRDILKHVTCSHFEFFADIIIGIENQSDIHYAMPVRDNLYDALNYASQIECLASQHHHNHDLHSHEFLSGIHSTDKLLPVITIVVYYGKRRWDGPLSLWDMMDFTGIPAEFQNAVQNYRIHLLQPLDMTDELIHSAQSDFGRVMELLRQHANQQRLATVIQSKEQYLLSKEAVAVIENFTGYYVPGSSEEKGVIDMNQEILELRAEGKAEGLSMGIIEGKVECIHSIMKKLHLTLEEACAAVGLSTEEYYHIVETTANN